MSFYLQIIEHAFPSGLNLSRFLSRQGFRCEKFDWKSFNPETLHQSMAQMIVAVTGSNTCKARPLFDWLRRNSIKTPTLAILPENAGQDLIREATEVVDDFLVCPIRPLELQYRLERLLGPSSGEVSSAAQLLTEEAGLAEMVGRDPAFVKLLNQIPLVGASRSPVMITGETGTGKELCARAIHMLSPRRSGPFIPVECGAVPEQLTENELFGHVRGAFTDAYKDQKGLAALAEGGTLFLDEVDSLSPAAQAKLLRFLQEGTYRPIGSERFSQGDVRVVAASNRNLDNFVLERKFRSDLYFRLNVLHLHMPPLRDRSSDISLLSRHFLERLCLQEGMGRKTLTPPALRKLESYSWPGNVRELYNVLQRAVVFSPGTQIHVRHVQLPASGGFASTPSASFREARSAAIRNFERRFIRELLHRHRGNITQASKEAGKDRRAFGRLVKKYKIDRHNP